MLQILEQQRLAISNATTQEHKSNFGQFLTPLPIATFMVNMFENAFNRSIRILDAGAGIGSLTAALVNKLSSQNIPSIEFHAAEIDEVLLPTLRNTLEKCCKEIEYTKTKPKINIDGTDFILNSVENLQLATPKRYTHAILNPPYKKIRSDSEHRKALRIVGIETTNMYAAFVALSILQLEENGELVAITPRSFCNGTYFKPFRKLLVNNCSITKVHVFESRKESFKDDDVQQENIIFHVKKGIQQDGVVLSSSYDSTFKDVREKYVAFDEIINPEDNDFIIHLPVNNKREIKELKNYTYSLHELGLSVSTGSVVDFRVKEDLSFANNNDEIPLIYPLNFENGVIKHPKESKKPSWICMNERTQRLAMPSGCYVLTRRFSSKEEKHRIVSAVFDAELVASKKVGFDNHLNVFHENKKGFSKDLAIGLSIYLSSSYVDTWFRNFSGHTQVNAGDLKMLKYPDRETLEEWGKILKKNNVGQEIIDKTVAKG